MYSHWEKKYWFSNVDFTIVGSGIVGLLTAIRLKEKKPQACIRPVSYTHLTLPTTPYV